LKKSKKKELPPLPASVSSSVNNSPPLPSQPPVPTSLAPVALEAAESKKKIPKKVKDDVWKTYIGEEIAKHKCLCCKMTTIDKAGFDCGHVVSEATGGGLEIKNLRPICSGCNHSMGTTNMVDYVKKHGYFIGGGM
jgi:5-methylcytosine-specific restriction endonuclease McrA